MKRFCECGTLLRRVRVWPFICTCGKRYGEAEIPTPLPVVAPEPPPLPEWLNSRLTICRTRCPHYLASGDRCGIQAAKGRAGELQYMVDNPCPNCTCPAPDPLWTPVAKFTAGGVGFLATAYMRIGGVETWHHTLLPRLPHLSGFVCLEHTLCEGDLSRLPCPADVGLEAAKRLARSCDVLVVWGIGKRLGEVMAGVPEAERPRVISVSHGDGSGVSTWSADQMRGQEPWTDRCVYLCQSGIETVPPAMRDSAVWIPNAPDPARVVPTRSRAEIRRELNVDDDVRLLVTFTRLSPEKRVEVLVEAASLLPENYLLVVAGKTGGWNDYYGDQLREMASDRVRIIEPVESPANLLTAADAYLSASQEEGYGLSTAEAMLSGVPVISTPVGLLESEPHLARIVGRDAGAAEWAAAIEEDFADPKGMHERAYLAQRAMRERHSVERFAGAWRELLGQSAQISASTG